MGNREGDGFLDVLVDLRKVKEETRWNFLIAWPAKSWSLGFVIMHGTLGLCVEFPLVACEWNFYYNISCIMLN